MFHSYFDYEAIRGSSCPLSSTPPRLRIPYIARIMFVMDVRTISFDY